MAEEEEVNNESNQNQFVQYTITGLEAGIECEPLLKIGGRKDDVEDDPYHDPLYRSGIFRIKRRWSVAHFVSALIMSAFTLTCGILLEDIWISSDLRDWFTAITILCCVIGLTLSTSSCYLLNSLTKIRRPRFFLLLVRLLAVLELVFLVTGISLTIAVGKADKENPWGNNLAYNNKSFVGVCSLLAISMVVEFIMAGAWLFHWWKSCNFCGAFTSVSASLSPGSH